MNTGPRVATTTAAPLEESISRLCAAVLPRPTTLFAEKRVLVKANFNSPDPYPASSDPTFLAALVANLKTLGASEIIIADSCGLAWQPATDVFRKIGVEELAARLGVKACNFDEGPWKTVPIALKHFDHIRVASAMFDVDRVVYACCMKTHRSARFSMSLKHAIGFLHPEDRRAMHDEHLETRIAEINTVIHPDLLLLDARRCFVTGGPAHGRIRRPGLVMASTDRVALDVEGLKILSSRWAWNRLLRDPWQHEQIRSAAALGVGVSGPNEYDAVRI
ncbi:MAG: DUF362 domain-containing protein [Lentisphaerae bacterium]|nr:DUF362 domain-containing protein [Lentisphaerota bacterium]